MSVQLLQRDDRQFPAYADSFAHLADELRKLDLLLRLGLLRFRGHEMPPETKARNSFSISFEEVERLLQGVGKPSDNAGAIRMIRQEISALQGEMERKLRDGRHRNIIFSLPALAAMFGLSPLEVQMIVICLAPELERKYDTIYAFLQDDITRKKPSIDLILDLLAETREEKWTMRRLLVSGSRLQRSGILEHVPDPNSPSGSSDLARFLRLDPRIVAFILGDNGLDSRLSGTCRTIVPDITLSEVAVAPPVKTRLRNLAMPFIKREEGSDNKTFFSLHGPEGCGKMHLALAICEEIQCPLLYLDALLLPDDSSARERILALAFREGLLTRSIIYLDNIDTLFSDDDPIRLFKKIEQTALSYGWLVFMAGEKPWNPQHLRENIVFHAIEVPTPEVDLREKCWQAALQKHGCKAEREWSKTLAQRFQLTPGAIQNAVRAGVGVARSEGRGKRASLADFSQSCRSQSSHNLGKLAVRAEIRCHWSDIVLPEEKIDLLKELCGQVKHRYTVFNEWGFAGRISRGRGLSALFSGPPGTGKTLAAEIVAAELELDLYKIDLAGVVSKYIGETEKNLSRIFREAERSNAILFFDEADALFGKRTEVKDAHDRYANIETSYLLQKMEEYEGMVILATNLRANMDEAFTRRIRFIVEFPFPDKTLRARMWEAHFPPEAPRAEDMDYDFLAEQFQVAGGNIRNIAVNSAFMAAEDNCPISMTHVMRAVKREFAKIGKLWTQKTPSNPRAPERKEE
ncbi:MAG: AAA family ATPase [Pseudomonadota bacterium]